jgi:hypothetical protein
MGPPLRSSAADAHYCIMVQIPRIYRIQVCGAMLRAQLASAPQIVPNTETQHHTREQSELPRLTLDGKIPIQVMGHRAGAPFLDRQPGLGAVERLDLMGWMAPSLHRRAMLVAVEGHRSEEPF